MIIPTGMNVSVHREYGLPIDGPYKIKAPEKPGLPLHRDENRDENRDKNMDENRDENRDEKTDGPE